MATKRIWSCSVDFTETVGVYPAHGLVRSIYGVAVLAADSVEAGVRAMAHYRAAAPGKVARVRVQGLYQGRGRDVATWVFPEAIIGNHEGGYRAPTQRPGPTG